jgi:IclR family mhp operon transcriptional activator
MAFAPVQAVRKAFALLEAVNRQEFATVKDLHEQTGLPKPTVVRLLQTLVAAGYISQDVRTRGYQVTSTVRQLSIGYHGAPFVIETSKPWANALTKKILWPCAICMLDFDAVTVEYSTITDSPISPFHASLGRRLSLGGRALGRAYLCFCAENEREILRKAMRSSEDPENSGLSDRQIDALVAEARRKGYAERDPELQPRSSGTIAVPIKLGERVMATIGITFFRSAVPDAKGRSAIFRQLRESADQIEAALANRVSG